jgi:hypothetical protein
MLLKYITWFTEVLYLPNKIYREYGAHLSLDIVVRVFLGIEDFEQGWSYGWFHVVRGKGQETFNLVQCIVIKFEFISYFL